MIKQQFSEFNENVINRKSEIEAALDTCSHIDIVVAYTGDGISGVATEVLNRLIIDEDLQEERFKEEISYFTADDVVKALRLEKAYQPVNTKIKLQKHQKICEPREVYYGVAKLVDLAALHEEFGKALYEKNIRYYLGSTKSNVNRSIKATLANKPQDFLLLNNGVTALSEIIDPKSQRAGYKNFNVRGFSIINGAQTVATAAEFIRLHPESNVDEAKVMLTIIKSASDSDFPKIVTKARNHQNPVQATHFAALDDTQERLRQDIAIHGYQYQYRPQSLSTPRRQLITLEEASKALALFEKDPRYLVRLKSEPSRFIHKDSVEYQSIFTTNLSAIHLINAVKLYRATRQVLLSNENSSFGKEKLIYRHGVFCIAGVLMKRLHNKVMGEEILNDTQINQIISFPLDELRQKTFEIMDVSTMFSPGPLAFFRNQTYALPVINEMMIQHYGQENETVSYLRNVTIGTDKYPKQQLVDYLISQAPQI